MNIIKGLKAISEKVDENEDWYKYRRSFCDTCSFNTKNGAKIDGVKDSVISTLEAIKPLINREDDDSGNCSVCTCYINKKCWDKTENCPLYKWKSLILSTNKLDLLAGSGINGIDFLDGKEIVYNIYLKDSLKGDIVDFDFYVTSKRDHLISANFSCPCAQLMQEPKLQKDHSYKLSCKLSTAGKERKEDYHRVSLSLLFKSNNFLVNIYFKVK